MARQGHRVLLIDNDPQGSLSRGFFGTQAVERLSKESTLAALYDKAPSATPGTLIVRTEFKNIDLMPTSQEYDPYNINPPHAAPYDFEALRRFIAATHGYKFSCSSTHRLTCTFVAGRPCSLRTMPSSQSRPRTSACRGWWGRHRRD